MVVTAPLPAWWAAGPEAWNGVSTVSKRIRAVSAQEAGAERWPREARLVLTMGQFTNLEPAPPAARARKGEPRQALATPRGSDRQSVAMGSPADGASMPRTH